MTKLWITGKWLRVGWEFYGVFSSREKAVVVCLDKNFFIGSAILDESLPIESVVWKDFCYPLLEEDK